MVVAWARVVAVETQVKRLKIYFGSGADLTGDGSKITSRSLLNPWIEDIQQIIHNKLLAVMIDDMKEKISVFGN